MAAPKGNQNARKAKDWEGALRRALAQYEDVEAKVRPGEALRKIAENVVKLALAGSKDAITEIACRLDGKPTEHVVGEFLHHHTSELSDDELAAIASGGGEGAAEPSTGETQSSGIH
jgi:hypothetical protein